MHDGPFCISREHCQMNKVSDIQVALLLKRRPLCIALSKHKGRWGHSIMTPDESLSVKDYRKVRRVEVEMWEIA